MFTAISLLDWLTIYLYIFITFFLGLLFSKNIRTAKEFSIGNKDIPYWVIGTSVAATYISSLSFVGGPAWAYEQGLSVLAIHINYPIVIAISIVFFIPLFYKLKVVSIYEYLEMRFGYKTRVLMASIFIVTSILSSAAILYSTSLVLKGIFSISILHSIVFIAIFSAFYSSLGGIKAVIWTDMTQMFYFICAAIVILVSLLQSVNYPLNIQHTVLQVFDFTLDHKVSTTAWSGLLAMTLYHLTVYGTNQRIVQRALAAKSIVDAQKSMAVMGYIVVPIYLIFVLIGTLLFVHYNGRTFENNNLIMLKYITELSIPGLLGLTISAVLAAAMSSLDSSLNSLSTVFYSDFYVRFCKKSHTSSQELSLMRRLNFFWSLVIIIPAYLYTKGSGSVLELLSQIGSYFVGAKLGIFSLALFSKSTSEKALLTGVFFGFAFVFLSSQFTDISWPWFCLIGFLVTVSVAKTASSRDSQDHRGLYTFCGQFPIHDKSTINFIEPLIENRISKVLLIYFSIVICLFSLWDTFVSKLITLK